LQTPDGMGNRIETGVGKLTTLAVVLFMAGGEISRSQSISGSLPAEMVRRAAQNEDKASQDLARFMYRDRKRTSHGVTTKLIVETKDTIADLLIAHNDKPLGADERQRAISTLERFARDPEELRRKVKQEKEEADRFSRVLRALPDAFLYESAGEEFAPSGVGHTGDRLLRLKFKPNSNYAPPSSVERVLTGMEGEILLDPVRMRIARIEGRLTKDEGFVWGFLAHLDGGGQFLLEQGTVDEAHWGITKMTLAFTGKILFKHFEIMSEEVFSGYCPVPGDLSFAQGVELLKTQRIDF